MNNVDCKMSNPHLASPLEKRRDWGIENAE
jgi:hypothetical protein